MSAVSLRQIAERVGCSRAAVSYALRNCSNISEETKRRVRAVAEELGWTPDAALLRQMALVRRSRGRSVKVNLAVVINKSAADLKRERAQRLQLEGAVRHARSRGFSVDVFRLGDDRLRPARLKSILQARGVDGIIYIASMDPEISRDVLEIGRSFACCVCGVRYAHPGFHVALPDLLAGGRLVVEELCRLGYRRPAAVVPHGVDSPLGYAYAGGWASGHTFLEPENRLQVLHAGTGENHLPEYEFSRIGKWIQESEPDSVLCTDVKALKRLLRGLGRPHANLPVFSLDWFPGQAVAGGLDQRHGAVGAAAVDLVEAQIHRGEKGVPAIQRAVNLEGLWRRRRRGGTVVA